MYLWKLTACLAFQGLGEKANDSLDMMFDTTAYGEYKSYNSSHLGQSQPCEEQEVEEEGEDDEEEEKSDGRICCFFKKSLANTCLYYQSC